MADWAEEAMSGLDEPRPLTDELRTRLERSLLATSGALALGGHLSDRLHEALSDPVGPLLQDLGKPRPLDPGVRQRLEVALTGRRHRRGIMWSAAAGVAVLAAVGTALGIAATRSAGPGVSVSALPGAGRPHAAPAPIGNATSNGTEPSASTGGASPLATATAPSTLVGPSSVSAGPAAASSPVVSRLSPSPVVSRLSPATGPTSGGTWVTVSGSGLAGTTAVDFGAVPASFTVISGNALRTKSPPHPPGIVDVQVTTAGGTSPLSSGGRFTYG